MYSSNNLTLLPRWNLYNKQKFRYKAVLRWKGKESTLLIYQKHCFANLKYHTTY